jgi:NAD-reducing hydrogenase small subunit
MSDKPKLATVWLDGCSGCHMSFLDMDERILVLATLADVVYSPLVDHKEFPDMVDITLIEGAVSSQEDFDKIRKVRAHTKVLVSLGDCAVTANVPAMRNRFKVDAVLDRAYFENAALNQQIPVDVIPPLRKKSVPVHQVVPVDVFIPGCPPSADIIYETVVEILQNRPPEIRSRTRFGA